ncbi:MAG: hypothetical protein K1X29_07490 [Bdellovibrionales bacterium]|nr:hypothetical protein [Bdellovibrionales bacterium]
MLQFGVCPRCQEQIDSERLGFNPVICSQCGFTDNATDIREDIRFEKRFIKVAILVAFLFTVGLLQSASWDKFALSIIPLKIKQMTHTASMEDLTQIIGICKERLKHECVESSLSQMAEKGNLEALAELGKYQMKLKKTKLATQSFNHYFKQGGLDLEASYQFAKALGELGEVDLASNYYDQVLKARPEALQITVTQNYVKMLVNNKRNDQALNLIKTVRSSSPSASLFMEDEYKTLVQAAVK